VAKKILIVEDDATNAIVLHDYLAAHGYEMAVARDGEEGVQKFRELHPDLVILDLLLPKMNGFEVCFDLRADTTHGDTPILLMSAVGREVYAEAYAEADKFTQGYLRKPFSMATLAERVAELVGAA
jgi:DNA-binding response OmpR family regulator